jgi:hypothetical protein
MDMEDYQVVAAPTPGKRGRNERYRASPQGSQKQKDRDSQKYLERKFIAWDGEGITTPGGIHRYIFLANSLGERIVSEEGLTSKAIFEFLWRTRERFPDAINIIYGGGYDFNFWLRDLPLDYLKRIYRERYASQGSIRIGWRRGKNLYVARKASVVAPTAKITVYDVLPFFQSTFIRACDSYLKDRMVERDLIVANKAIRGNFTMSMLEEMYRYNDAELENLVLLAEELRIRLDRVGLRPLRWDGPGAIATALFKREKVNAALSRKNPISVPAAVAEATQQAYAGGRFEVLRFGTAGTRAYEYDINSAYPAALRYVPCLAHGQWIHVVGSDGVKTSLEHDKFGLYNVRYSRGHPTLPGPLYRRVHDGTISYPRNVSGFYWTPEAFVSREYCRTEYDGKRLGEWSCEEAWIWEGEECDDEQGHRRFPLAFVENLYRQRALLKSLGDGAHVGLKLGLNSMYGKFAQQVGWFVDREGNLHIPPYHELAWAGYATSYCRAKILNAALLDISSVIAFETDALFTSRPIPVEIGTELGQWEVTDFRELHYAQSGLYFAVTDLPCTCETDANYCGKHIVKTRGVDRGTLKLTDYLNAITAENGKDRVMHASLTRFLGLGVALTQGLGKWCTWNTTPKIVSAEPIEGSKRNHYECDQCWTPAERAHGARGYRPGVLHTTTCHKPGGESAPFALAWEDGESYAAQVAAEAREEQADDWDGRD